MCVHRRINALDVPTTLVVLVSDVFIYLFIYLFVRSFVRTFIYHDDRVEKWLSRMRIKELSFINFPGDVRDNSCLYFNMLGLVK